MLLKIKCIRSGDPHHWTVHSINFNVKRQRFNVISIKVHIITVSLMWPCYILLPVKRSCCSVSVKLSGSKRSITMAKYLWGGSLGSVPGVRSMGASSGEGSRFRHDARDWLESSREAVRINKPQVTTFILTIPDLHGKLWLPLLLWNKNSMFAQK